MLNTPPISATLQSKGRQKNVQSQLEWNALDNKSTRLTDKTDSAFQMYGCLRYNVLVQQVSLPMLISSSLKYDSLLLVFGQVKYILSKTLFFVERFKSGQKKWWRKQLNGVAQLLEHIACMAKNSQYAPQPAKLTETPKNCI